MRKLLKALRDCLFLQETQQVLQKKHCRPLRNACGLLMVFKEFGRHYGAALITAGMGGSVNLESVGMLQLIFFIHNNLVPLRAFHVFGI